MDNIPEGGAPRPPAEAREGSPAMTPQQHYESLLGRYAAKTKTIRHLERSHREDKAEKLDGERHALHTRMIAIAAGLGKNEDQVFYDILLSEGNLDDLGVRELPVIQLPMVGARFRTDSQRGGGAVLVDTSVAMDAKSGILSQTLSRPDGTEIATLYRPPGRTESEDPNKITFSGDQTAFDKWRQHPYFVLVFASRQWTNYQFTDREFCDGYTKRMQRMAALALDLDLNLFETNDGGNHKDVGARVIHGIEVPVEKIEDVATAIRSNPGKYWLTDDEIDNPTTVASLLQEDEDVLRDGYYALREQLKKQPLGIAPDPKLVAARDNYLEVAGQKNIELRFPYELAERKIEPNRLILEKLGKLDAICHNVDFDIRQSRLHYPESSLLNLRHAVDSMEYAYLYSRRGADDAANYDIAHQRVKDMQEFFVGLHPTKDEVEDIIGKEGMENFLLNDEVVHDIRLIDFLSDPNVAALWQRLPEEAFTSFMQAAKEGRLPSCFTSEQEMERLKQSSPLDERRDGTARQLLFDLSTEPAESRKLKTDFNLEQVLNEVNKQFPQ